MKIDSKRKRVFVLALILNFIFSSQLFAAGKKEISMDFDNADIRVVIKFISELTGKNMVVDSKVKGNVTVISPTKISEEEAYRVFDSILEVNGYSAVETAGIIKIIPKPDASKSQTRTRVGKDSKKVPRNDRIVTQIIPLDYASSTQVRAALAPLISKNGIIIDFAASNTIIVTDISSNIHRLVRIVQEIDLEDVSEKIEIIALRYASAGNFAKQLTSIFPLKKQAAAARGKRRAPQAGQSALKVIPYERTNSIIVVADESNMESIKALVEILDVETEVEAGEIHVVYLKNAVAEDISKVLSSMTQQRRNQPTAQGGASGGIPISGNIIITPDKATNSLVITASPSDYRVITTVIDKLDIRRKQVYVEASIMEISVDKQRELGFEFRGTSDPTASSGAKVIGGTTFGGIEAASSNPLGLTGQGLVLGAVDGTITFRGTEYLNIGALLRAIETESGVNVLSTPHLLTTDNEEAEIVVGENVPFITSKTQTTAGEPITTIERKDVGITLKITPQINESDFVKLKIYQEISSVKEVTLEEAADLITTKRSAKTTVVVKDGQTVAIGGLIRDNDIETKNKVPCLGDIPLLGMLFRFTSVKKEKTNLLIFLSPRIIRDSAEMDAIMDEKKRDMDAFREEHLPKSMKKDSDGDTGESPEK
ncbi:MAG: type II secretion system secretin GspD [Proteobacteria bacterium]|nr:type II secretion system secretin GspD [Pseudomonadota bacterium]